MKLRPDEHALATYVPGADPPDLLVTLDDDRREVGVELARVIGEEHAAGLSADLQTLRRGGRPEPVVWTPDAAAAITTIVTKKSAKYVQHGDACPDWLVLHDSVERPGWYDQPVEGHAYFVERCANPLRTSPFETIILQSTYRQELQWSVLWTASR